VDEKHDLLPDAEQRARLVTAYAKNKEYRRARTRPPRPYFGPRTARRRATAVSTPPRPLCSVLPGFLLHACHARRPPVPQCLRHEIPRHPAMTVALPTGHFSRMTATATGGTNSSGGIGTCVLGAPHDGVDPRCSRLAPFATAGRGALILGSIRSRAPPILLMVQALEFPEQRRQSKFAAISSAACKALVKH